MNYLKKSIAVTLLIFPFTALAITEVPPTSALIASDAASKQVVISAFRKYLTISPKISVPTVLEIPLSQDTLMFPTVAVYNLVTNQFEPYLLTSVVKEATPSQITALNSTGSTYALIDGSFETYLEFPVREGANKAEILFTFDKPIVASSLSFALDNYVALPQTISIQTEGVTGPYTVLAPTRLYRSSVTFPKTTSAVWRISFTYAQPLRITEMKFNESSSGLTTSRNARFLAQPGQSYQVYIDADRYVRPVQKEAGNLSSNNEVFIVSSTLFTNPLFTAHDSDGDRLPDLTDNCTSIINADQTDSDMNGRGDACEDYDRDSIAAARDNCQNIPNQNQIDTDADGIGDACDALDNRMTERMPWLPWVGIGVAGMVLIVLFVLAVRYKKDDTLPATPLD